MTSTGGVVSKYLYFFFFCDKYVKEKDGGDSFDSGHTLKESCSDILSKFYTLLISE